MRKIIPLMILLLFVLIGCSNDKPQNDKTVSDLHKQELQESNGEEFRPESSEKQESPVEDFVYKMKDGEVTITGYKGTDREIYIPNEINDRPVTKVGREAFAGYDMTLVDIPENVRVICEDAFCGCNCLVNLQLHEGLQRIEKYAFYSCDLLENVDLPATLGFLGDSCFGGTAIRKLFVPNESMDFDFEDDVLITETDEDGNKKQTTTKIIKSPISSDAQLAVVDLSETERTIMDYSWGRVNWIRVTDEGKPVSGTWESALSYSWSKSIGGYTIDHYVGDAEEVVIPDQIDDVPVLRIGMGAFKETKVTRVSIGSQVEAVEMYAFQDCTNLREVEFRGNSDVLIGMDSFAGCPKLLELRLPPAARFNYKWEKIWLEEYKIHMSVTSETKIELPFDEDDVTIMVVQCGSKVHETLMADEDVQGKFRVE